MKWKYLDEVMLGVGVAIALIFSYWIGQQAYGWMPPQATEEARQVDSLFSFLISLGAFVFLGITGMIGWALLTCRAQPGDFSEGHPARSSTTLEILWTLGPTVLVIWIALQSQAIYQLLDLEGLNTVVQTTPTAVPVSTSPPTSEITIEVTASQWSWSFRYPDNIVSDELHLPINQQAHLVLNSADVLHGFYVPAFRVKQDMIPDHPINFSLTPRRAGEYRLQDSQFSGTYFSLMTAKVYVESLEQFHQWLATTATFEPTLADNLAVTEHAQPSHKLGSHWPSIAPSPPARLYAESSRSSHPRFNSEASSITLNHDQT